MFRVLLDLGEDKGVSATRIAQLVALINVWKNARSHLVDIGFRADTSDALDVRDELSAAGHHAADDTYPWGRRYDGTIDHDHGVRHFFGSALVYDGAADHTGWGETGELYSNRWVELTTHLDMTIEDRVAVEPLHDGRYVHAGITYGEDQPSVADPTMSILLTRAIRHDGRYRHAGDLHDGETVHDATHPYWAGIFHSGPVHTPLTAI